MHVPPFRGDGKGAPVLTSGKNRAIAVTLTLSLMFCDDRDHMPDAIATPFLDGSKTVSNLGVLEL